MGSEARFSEEWQKYSKILPEYETQFINWVSPLDKKSFKNLTILDAGCGNGRNSFWPLIYGAKAVYSFDHDQKTVRVAKKNLARFKNSKVFYGSIYDIPYRNKFDLVFSIGVVHHLDNPDLAVEQLIKAAKRGGRVMVWLYGYEGNEILVPLVNGIRTCTKHLPPIVVRILAFFPAVLVYCQTHFLPTKHPYLKQLSKLSFRNIHSIVFDQLLPNIARYYTKEDATRLLANRKLRQVKAHHVNGNSWSVSGIKR